MTARPSRDPAVAANQETTKQWWLGARASFDLFISRIVLLEIAKGDGEFAKLRLALAKQIRSLDVTPKCDSLAENLLAAGGLPRNAAQDAFHIAIAAVHRMDFLLTWNCRHIANEVLIPRLGSIIKAHGYASPVLCTPPQLLDRRLS
jgi:hypothetical protein